METFTFNPLFLDNFVTSNDGTFTPQDVMRAVNKSYGVDKSEIHILSYANELARKALLMKKSEETKILAPFFDITLALFTMNVISKNHPDCDDELNTKLLNVIDNGMRELSGHPPIDV